MGNVVTVRTRVAHANAPCYRAGSVSRIANLGASPTTSTTRTLTRPTHGASAPRSDVHSMLRLGPRAQPFAFSGGIHTVGVCLRAQDTTQWEAKVWWSQEHVQWGPMG